MAEEQAVPAMPEATPPAELEDAADTLAETVSVAILLAVEAGMDPNAAMKGSWEISEDGSVMIVGGDYSGTMSAEDVMAALDELESEEPMDDADDMAAE